MFIMKAEHLRDFIAKTDFDLNKYYDPKTKKMKMMYSRLHKNSEKYDLPKKFRSLLNEAESSGIDVSEFKTKVENFKQVDTVKGLQNKARRNRRRRLKMKKNNKQGILTDNTSKMSKFENKRRFGKPKNDEVMPDTNPDANFGVETGGPPEAQQSLKANENNSKHLQSEEAHIPATKEGNVLLNIVDKPAVPAPADLPQVIGKKEKSVEKIHQIPDDEAMSASDVMKQLEGKQEPESVENAMSKGSIPSDPQYGVRETEDNITYVDREMERDGGLVSDLNIKSTIKEEEDKQRKKFSVERLREEIKAFRLLYNNNIKTAHWRALGKKNPTDVAALRQLHKEYEAEILEYFQKDSLGKLRIGVLISPEALGMNVPALQQMLGMGHAPVLPNMISNMAPTNDAVAGNVVSEEVRYNEGGLSHALSEPLPEIENMENHKDADLAEDANVKARVQIIPSLKHRFHLPRFNQPLRTFKIKS